MLALLIVGEILLTVLWSIAAGLGLSLHWAGNGLLIFANWLTDLMPDSKRAVTR